MLVLIMAVCSGCRSLRPEDNEGLFAGRDFFSSERLRQPLENVFAREGNALEEGEKYSAEGRRQLEIARKQFDSKQYTASIKTYKKVANKYKGSSIGEEAWFRVGEAYFALGEYPNAQDAYNKLFADYPSTKYVSDASQRLFAIARAWLDVSDPGTSQKITTVSDTKVVEAANPNVKSQSGASARYRLLPNFFDKTRPLLDTPGRAQNALKSIWLNDPTGPLADDALMLTASYYLKRRNFVEADRYLEILRDEYPDSPHLEQAYVLGGHVKQMSYQGPMYDGSSLVAATNLKERSLSLFPNSADRSRIQGDLQKLYLQDAQRSWSKVEFWQKKDNTRSVAIQCKEVVEQFPDTPYANRARSVVRQIPISTVQDLPGMAEFIQDIQSSAPTNSFVPPDSSNGGNTAYGRVKSVSDQKSRNPFRLLGFGK
ncbi:MAG: outer membrane protein assembly factor BamD [Fuerstiella sp.]